MMIVVGLFGFYVAYFYAWLIAANPNMNEVMKARYETIVSMLALPSLLTMMFGFFIFLRSLWKK